MEMGAKSLRSGDAMAMYLVGASPLKNMITGIWRSDTLLLYIQKQATQFSTKVSYKMQQNKEFFTVPNFERKIQEEKMEPSQFN